MRFATVVLLLLGLASAAAAQSLDAASSEALSATLRLLLDRTARGAAISGNPQASAVDQQIQALTGSPQLAQELYALAAQIFEDLARNTGGDIGKLSQAVERGRTNPQEFAATLSPATLQRLRELATRISDRPR